MRRPICIMTVILLLSIFRFGFAHAAPLLQNGTLADYIALGSGGGQIEDKLFYDFSYSAAAGVSPSSASGVTVGVISTAFNPGLTFMGSWIGTGSFEIDFKVSVLTGGNPLIG
jgi:hypothetical protein